MTCFDEITKLNINKENSKINFKLNEDFVSLVSVYLRTAGLLCFLVRASC